MDAATQQFLAAMVQVFDLDADVSGRVTVDGEGALPSAFSVTSLAVAAMATAGLAAAKLAEARGRRHADAPVVVDRRLASGWFGWSIRPQGWELPPVWDAVAGDYRCADGWIRLHTNAPHHRAAARAVLGNDASRESVAAAVASWNGDALEYAIVEAGGCAAALRAAEAWASHPQGQAVASEPLVATAEGTEGPQRPWSARAGAGADADAPLLAGVRVVDLTRVLAGPVATRFLAGLGAEVLRVDPPGWDEPAIAPEVTLGKRCSRLDLTNAEGRATLLTLLSQADVVVHGYRADALERLGLGVAERAAAAPGLVDVCLDAYGWSGPWAGRRGFDSLVQMSSGIAAEGRRTHPDHVGLSAAEQDERPPVSLPVQALDHATGYFLAAAALVGLVRRAEGGPGLVARASLAATARLLLSGPAGSFADRFSPFADDDFGPVAEATAWGPARRLRPPLRIGRHQLHWDRPAGPLGSHPPTFASTSGATPEKPRPTLT